MNWKFELEADPLKEDEILFILGPVGLKLNTYIYSHFHNMKKLIPAEKKVKNCVHSFRDQDEIEYCAILIYW